MKASISKFFIVFLCLIILCSCARQRYISQNEFAKSFNACSQAVKLSEDGYYEKDGEFCFFTSSENLREILISFKQNEKFYVTQAELTAVKDGKDLTDEEKQELLKTAVSMLSVICNCSEEEINSELSKLKFDKSKFGFGNTSEEFSVMKAKCFFYTNSEMLSLKIEIK